MRTCIGLAVACLSACSNGLPNIASKEHHFKISESGSAYISDVNRYESLGQKSLTRGQIYRISELGDRTTAPFFLVANITQYVGGKKGDVKQGAMLYVEDGTSEYDCSKFMTDRKLSESDEDTPVVSCNFKLIGVLPVPETATVQKDQPTS
jgi:hypothetical protein